MTWNITDQPTDSFPVVGKTYRVNHFVFGSFVAKAERVDDGFARVEITKGRAILPVTGAATIGEIVTIGSAWCILKELTE